MSETLSLDVGLHLGSCCDNDAPVTLILPGGSVTRMTIATAEQEPDLPDEMRVYLHDMRTFCEALLDMMEAGRDVVAGNETRH
jgi:hypothetical protein